ncbi:MAG: sodium ion-translocating decarboxylase subunit beta [Ruminococcaceae bacterium]|nr:sodium ion-translocating decarboxylase subunit beta [Oscillospiraceae bacterium]
MRKLILPIILLMSLLTGCGEKNSIGVIGGADGPTAIIVSSGFDWWQLVVIPICTALAVLLVWKVRK